MALLRPAMRRYHELALTVVTTASLLALFYYKHQYDTLRHVLSVMEFFGQPSLSSPVDDLPAGYPVIGFHPGTKPLYTPASSWSRVHDNLFVFSAFHVHFAASEAVALVIFAASKKSVSVSLWAEVGSGRSGGERGEKIPLKRRLASAFLNGDLAQTSEEVDFLFFTASSPSVSQGDTVFLSSSDVENSTVVTLPILSSPANTPPNDSPPISLCLGPPPTSYLVPTRLSLLELFVHYNALAVTYFQLYLPALPFDSRFGEERATTHVWNFPWRTPKVSGAMRTFLLVECALRSRQVGSVAVFIADSVTSFWVPKVTLTIPGFLSGLDHEDDEAFHFSHHLFCTNATSSRKRAPFDFISATDYIPSEQPLEYTLVTTNALIDHLFVPRREAVPLKTKSVMSSLVAVHEYRECKAERELVHRKKIDGSVGLHVDDSMLMMRPALLKSPSLQPYFKRKENDRATL